MEEHIRSQVKSDRPQRVQVAVEDLTNEALASSIVLYRSVSVNKEFARCCMEELSIRRKNGSEFNYEEYIDIHLKSITPLLEKLPKKK